MPGEWSVTSARHPNLKDLALLPSLLQVNVFLYSHLRLAFSGASDVCIVNIHMLSFGIQVVTVVVADQVGCVAAVVWTVEGQGDPAAFVGAEVWTVEASEEGVAWTEAVLEEEVVVALLWMTWEEGGEEWDHLAKWI